MPDLAIKDSPEVVVVTVNGIGLKRAAKKYKTSPSSLSRWIRGHGYESKYQYIKVAAPQQS